MKVEIKSKNRVYDGFFKIDEVAVEHERFDGSKQTIKRLCFERGDAVAAVVLDPKTNELLFTEQFRYPAYSRSGESTIVELVAGMVKPEEESSKTLEREIVEELGYEIDNSTYLGTYFLSPGGSSERVFLYFVKLGDKIGNGGGLLEENEDIRIIRIPVDELVQESKWSLGLTPSIAKYNFDDAKTQLGLMLSQKLWS